VTDGQDKLQTGSKLIARGKRAVAPAGQRYKRSKRRQGCRLRNPGFMSPSRLFILRPVATTLLMVGVLLVGWVAFSRTCPFPPCRRSITQPFR
jgi:hypothetical protein